VDIKEIGFQVVGRIHLADDGNCGGLLWTR